MDLSFLHNMKSNEFNSMVKFQSLFLWIFRSYKTWVNSLEIIVRKFQSLFLWIFRSYGNRGSGIIYRIERVSILVLMDLSFLHIDKLVDDLRFARWGFQSLFLWIFRSYINQFIYCVINVNGVSILVLMDLSFLQNGYEVSKNNDFWFQSLFLWIFRSYKVVGDYQYSNDTDLFQSLFLWIFRSYCPSCSFYYLLGKIRFNPCSYGSFVLTETILKELDDITNAFQSLFLWIFRSYKPVNNHILIHGKKFQSLFLWIFRSYLKIWIHLLG